MKWNQLGGSSSGSPSGGGGGFAGASDITDSSGEAPDNLGRYDVNMFAPAESAQQVETGFSGLLSGFRQAIFGRDNRPAGHEGGLLGGVPIIGEGGRALTSAVASLPGHAADALGGLQEHIAIGSAYKSSTPSFTGKPPQTLDQEYGDLEKLAPEIKAHYDAMLNDTSGGIGPFRVPVADAKIKSEALAAFKMSELNPNPSAFDQNGAHPGTFLQAIGQGVDSILGNPSRAVEAGITAASPRLGQIKAVAESGGASGFTAGGSALTDVEESVYRKVFVDGTWSRDEGANFLTSHQQGYSHDALTEISASALLDPWNLAFGVGVGVKALKLGAKGLMAVAEVEKEVGIGEKALRVAEQLGDTEAIGAASSKLNATRNLLEEMKAAPYVSKADEASQIRKINILARAVKTNPAVRHTFERMAGPLLGSYMADGVAARAGKVARTLIDPLHALGQTPKIAKKLDLATDQSVRIIVRAAGEKAHVSLLERLHGIAGRGLVDSFADGLGRAAWKNTRDGLAEAARQAAEDANTTEGLKLISPDDAAEAMVHAVSPEQADRLLDRAIKTQSVEWTPETLDRMATGASAAMPEAGLDAAGWAEHIDQMSDGERILMHRAIYAKLAQETERLKGLALLQDKAGKLGAKLSRLTLIRRDTLTQQGADGIVARILGKAEAKDASGLATSWQGVVDELKAGAKTVTNPETGEALAALSTEHALAFAEKQAARWAKVVSEGRVVKGAVTPLEAFEEMKTAQAQYPALRAIEADPHDLQGSVDEFVKYIDRIKGSFPMQALDEEVQGMSDALRAHHDAIKDAYTFGFMPEAEELWGVARVGKRGGRYASVHSVWTGPIPDQVATWIPSRAVTYNIAGKPIVGAAAGAALRKLDHIEAYYRTMSAGVKGAAIATRAEQKFHGIAKSQLGLSEPQSRDIWDRLMEFTGEHDYVAKPTAFQPDTIWNAVSDLIPPSAARNGLTRDSLMSSLLRSYDGDVRFLGLTSKLSQNLKNKLSLGGKVNFAGYIAETAYPNMKFRLNVLFASQERIESIILSSMRGASVHAGGDVKVLSAADEITKAVLDKAVNTSLKYAGDIDQVEYRVRDAVKTGLNDVATSASTRTARATKYLDLIGGIQGNKRINFLRTTRQGMAKEMRPVWEAHMPGVWDEMLKDFQQRHVAAGGGILVDEDEFAMHMILDKMQGNDVIVQAVADKAINSAKRLFNVDLRPIFLQQQWSKPNTLGAIEKLDIDGIARTMGYRSGRGTRNIAEDEQGLRALLADKDSGVTMERIAGDLRAHGASEDYIARVGTHLDFHWEKFLGGLKEKYHLSDDAAKNIERMLAVEAESRGLTPVEYVSQFLAPNIGGGDDVLLGGLGDLVDVERAGNMGKAPSVSVLGATREATRDDLIKQLSKVFFHHMDPSAKRAMLLEFRPELKQAVESGRVRMDLADIGNLFDDDAFDQFAAMLDNRMSTRPIQPSEELATTFDEYDKTIPTEAKAPRGTYADIPTLDSLPLNFSPKPSGNLRTALHPDLRELIAREANRLSVEFPDAPVGHLTVFDLSYIGEGRAHAVTLLSHGGEKRAIILGEESFGKNYKAAQEAAYARNLQYLQRHGVPYHPGIETAQQTLYHEWAHSVFGRNMWYEPGDLSDLWVRRTKELDTPVLVARQKVIRDFFERFAGTGDPAAKAVPGSAMYRFSGYGREASVDEGAGDLFAFAFNPENAEYWAHMRVTDPEMWGHIEDFRNTLRDAGIYHPQAAILNSDMERVAQHFSSFTQNAIAANLKGGSPYDGIFRDVARIPTNRAVAYNATEEAMHRAVVDAVKSKWEDSYRLHYYARNRTMAERSINHPMFGIYPASYMWGKLGPEMIRFIARSPFGLETGGLAYNMYNTQEAIMNRREWDPAFDAHLQETGNNGMLWFLGYMMPAVPWDMGASSAAWVRDIAQSGYTNKWDLKKIGEDATYSLAPTRQADLLSGIFRKEKHVAVQPITPRLYGQPEFTEGATQATGLGPTLTQAQTDLTQTLSGK